MANDAQVKAEADAIASAPVVAIKTGVHGRCFLCGRIRSDLVYLDTMHGQERFVGGCCGNTNGVTNEVRSPR
jgi:hypothetical protein